MPSTDFEYADLPASLQSHLEQFCADISARAGENLISVAVYGDVTKSGQCAVGETSVPVLVVLQDASIQSLKPIAEVIRRAIQSFHAAPFVVSLHDLQTSTDIFPIKFLDMQTHHFLLAGRDVLSELDISTQHLRLRCEQELCNLLLRLRQAWLKNPGSVSALQDVITRSVSPLFSALGAAVSLQTELLPDSTVDTADCAARVMSLDRALLGRLLELINGKPVDSKADIEQLFNGLLGTVENAADFVDRLESEASLAD